MLQFMSDNWLIVAALALNLTLLPLRALLALPPAKPGTFRYRLSFSVSWLHGTVYMGFVLAGLLALAEAFGWVLVLIAALWCGFGVTVYLHPGGKGKKDAD